jgi:hypothetical protein
MPRMLQEDTATEAPTSAPTAVSQQVHLKLVQICVADILLSTGSVTLCHQLAVTQCSEFEFD